MIIILAFNFLFWVSVVVWRAMSMGGIVTASRRYVQGMRSLLRSAPPPSPSPQPPPSSVSAVLRRLCSPSPQSNACLAAAAENGCHSNHPPPPPYEEAIKYPSVSSLLSGPHVDVASVSGYVNRATELLDSRSSEEEAAGRAPATSKQRRQLTRSLSCGDLNDMSCSAATATAAGLPRPLHPPLSLVQATSP